MRRINLSQIWPVVIVAGLLAGLALAAPSYNAQNVAPRSVFLTLPDTLPEPGVALMARQDTPGRWTLRVDASGFRFTALCLSEAEAIPVGHAHVIRNGVKVASAYHPIVDLGVLQPGRHVVTAVLRGQDHRALLGKSGLIHASIVIDVPPFRTLDTYASGS